MRGRIDLTGKCEMQETRPAPRGRPYFRGKLQWKSTTEGKVVRSNDPSTAYIESWGETQGAFGKL
jgi:hypothetical protein